MTDIDRVAVGKRIKEIRTNFKDKKLSMEAFGKMMSPPAEKSLVSKWEKGIYIPNTSRLGRIAFLGNTTIDYLLYGTFQDSLGYGKRIQQIREEELNMTRETFGRSFTPKVSAEVVRSWENELSIPPKDYLNSIAHDGLISRTELMFGKRKHSRGPFNPFHSLDVVEDQLENSNLNISERVQSDIFFTRFNELRLAQIDSPEFFETLYEFINHLHYNFFPDGKISTTSESQKESREYLKTLFDDMLQKI